MFKSEKSGMYLHQALFIYLFVVLILPDIKAARNISEPTVSIWRQKNTSILL